VRTIGQIITAVVGGLVTAVGEAAGWIAAQTVKAYGRLANAIFQTDINFDAIAAGVHVVVSTGVQLAIHIATFAVCAPGALIRAAQVGLTLYNYALVGEATYQLLNGNFSVSNLLQVLPALASKLGKTFKSCFTGDTQVIVGFDAEGNARRSVSAGQRTPSALDRGASGTMNIAFCRLSRNCLARRCSRHARSTSVW
jgi:hypothetical protein